MSKLGPKVSACLVGIEEGAHARLAGSGSSTQPAIWPLVGVLLGWVQGPTGLLSPVTRCQPFSLRRWM